MEGGTPEGVLFRAVTAHPTRVALLASIRHPGLGKATLARPRRGAITYLSLYNVVSVSVQRAAQRMSWAVVNPPGARCLSRTSRHTSDTGFVGFIRKDSQLNTKNILKGIARRGWKYVPLQTGQCPSTTDSENFDLSR